MKCTQSGGVPSEETRKGGAPQVGVQSGGPVNKGVMGVYDSYRTDSGFSSCSAVSLSPDCSGGHRESVLSTAVSIHCDDRTKFSDSGISVDFSSSTTSSTMSVPESSVEGTSEESKSQQLTDSGLGLDIQERFSKLSVDSVSLTGQSTDNVLHKLDTSASRNLENYVNNNIGGGGPLDRDGSYHQLVDPLSRQRMVDEAYDPDKDGDTHLHLAIVHGRWDIITRLVQLAPDPIYLDFQNNLFQTPLHLAVLMGLSKVVRRLVLAGATLDIRNKLGNTPLHLACERGDAECVRELLRPVSIAELDALRRHLSGGTNSRWLPFHHTVPQDLEIRNYEGQMCVHLAALGQHVDVIHLLRLYGANINAQDGKSGRTALCYAVEARNLDLMAFLVRDCQASINETTYAGVTPFQLAYAVGGHFAEVLLGLGAHPTVPVLSSDSDSDYSSTEESMDTNNCSSNYFDLKINGEPFW